jgi:hypothetical protein
MDVAEAVELEGELGTMLGADGSGGVAAVAARPTCVAVGHYGAAIGQPGAIAPEEDDYDAE